MSMSHICRATCKTPKNLDVVGVHVAGIRQCSAFALHLACIRSRCSAVADQKKAFVFYHGFIFFYHRKWFSEICRADFLSLRYLLNIQFVERKVKKKSSPPGERNSPPPPPPRISSPGYGPAFNDPSKGRKDR